MNPVILCADSTCDLGDVLKKRYSVHYYPYHIILGDRQYQDGVDISADEIYQTYYQRRILPKTAAINAEEFVAFFKPWVEKGYDIIHVNLGSGLSSSHQNCCIAAKELGGHVYPVDSYNLSTGSGLLVIEAAERIAAGMPAQQIQRELNELRPHCHASFIIDTLEFLHAGGRCSALAALGANFLNLKPCIEVDNSTGNMGVGKKYRGSLQKVLPLYTRDKLQGRTDLKLDRVFITHSGISPDYIRLVSSAIREYADFKELFVTRAGSTISSHCGPNTLGVLFMTK